jgi:hypothetical protein
MKLKQSIFLSATCLSLLVTTQTYAQTIDDALIFSQENNGTSARIRGLGDAQTALGGDISAINGNPAGVGFFGRSDISATFNYLQNNTSTDYEGMNMKSKKGNFGIDQAGVVFHFPIHNYSRWQNFNMGVSYNKTQNFNNFRSYEGNNVNSSYVNALVDIMPYDADFEGDFYWSNIVEKYPAPNDNQYFPLAIENGDKMQYNEHIVKGNRSKTGVAFGANYNNKFYIGATLGITSFRYDKQTQFIENGWTKTAADVAAINPGSIFVDPNNVEYDYLDASYELFDTYSQIVEGSGADVKVGVIYKPTVDWNIGVTVTSPTWTTIKEDTRFYTDINFYDDESTADPFDYYESDYYDSAEDYRLTTPWKFAVGVSNFFGRGLISADAEIIDYSTMKYSSLSNNLGSDSYYRDINDDIKDIYQTAVNFRIGGEYLFNNVVSGRAGFNYFGNPYKDADDSNLAGSVGLGIKLSPSTYLDLAVNHQLNSYKEAAYFMNNQPSPIADINHRRTNIALTLGAKF